MPQGQARRSTTSVVAAGAACRFPLSSAARTLTRSVVGDAGTKEYDHEVVAAAVVPDAGCQVVPPSSETSTPATTPPVSPAVPESR